MNRIEHANRLHGKGPPDAGEHVVRDGDDVASTLKPPQCTSRGAFRIWGQPSARARTIARPASANVNADVIDRVFARNDFSTNASCSRSAATSAVDSI